MKKFLIGSLLFLTIGVQAQEQPDERVGRWAGMSKEECGIHTEFVQK